MYLLYSLLLVIGVIAGSPWFLYQAIRHRKYVGSARQRLGLLPVSFNLDGDPSIWVHAVSVGEVLAARPLLEALKARYPRLRLYLSTTTLAGSAARAPAAGCRRGVLFPVRFRVHRPSGARHRAAGAGRARREARSGRTCSASAAGRGVKTIVVNGRVSNRSYPRYRLVRPLFRRVLADLDRLCMQSEESARRIVAIGADQPERVVVTGSLKFDAAALPALPHGRDRVLRFFRVSPDRASSSPAARCAAKTCTCCGRSRA